MAENGRELTSFQKRAIAALLSTRNIREAAKAARVAERTLYTWLTEPAFKLALSDAEGQALDAATRRLLSLQDSAIGTIESVMDTAQSDHVKLRAAQSVLDYLLKLRELRNLESRLLALEERYEGYRQTATVA